MLYQYGVICFLSSYLLVFYPHIFWFFSVRWYQPHTAELESARYAIFFTPLLYPPFGNTPLFRSFRRRNVFKHRFSLLKRLYQILYSVSRMKARKKI